MWKDVQFGIRLLARSPVFALTAIFLPGIGIGANTAIQSGRPAVRVIEENPNRSAGRARRRLRKRSGSILRGLSGRNE